MKKGFTIIEVSILFVIFLIVAFLVAPLSLDDTAQAKNTSRWRNVQMDFANVYYSMNTQEDDITNFKETFRSIIENDVKGDCPSYKITFKNGTYPNNTYRFSNFKTTFSNATLAIKLFDNPKGQLHGMLMYDVNGKTGPNVWGRDVFGLNIYNDKFEPFCKNDPLNTQKQDCSNNGSGLCCSNYYLMGGHFD